MLLGVVIIGLIIGGILFCRFTFRSPSSLSVNPPSSLSLPAVGTIISGEFIRRTESIHVICQVEEQKETNLVLRVLGEVGRMPLMGLRSGAIGQIEVGKQRVPLQVIQVDYPWLEVEAHLDQARVAPRQELRLPAAFAVRFRPQGVTDPWMNGEGVNVSSGGFCLRSSSLGEPCLGLVYEIEVILEVARGKKEVLSLQAEARWITQTANGPTIGLRVVDSTQRRALARVVSRIQHRLSRHPEDYLTEPKQKPQLG